MRRIAILDAPSNLGLRPPTETSVPGCAKAPGALRDHGLLTRLGARDAGCLTPPRYDPGDWRPGDGVCHAREIAAYSRRLADRIGAIIDAGEFPVVLGGDCSIVLGSGLAMHRLGDAVGGRIGLVFVDGHSDFRHPGNASYVGAAAGEDLALVTGRGQADLAAIEGRRPYFRDIDVVVMGIRAQDEYRLDLQAAGIVTRPVPMLRVEGAARSAQWARDQLVDCAGFWVHVDMDVLDPAVMPAVDAPQPGGIAFPELEILLAGLVDTPHCLGVEITVFDPDYDPDGAYAEEITSALVAGLTPVRHVDARPDLVAAREDLASSNAPHLPRHATGPGRLRPAVVSQPAPADGEELVSGFDADAESSAYVSVGERVDLAEPVGNGLSLGDAGLAGAGLSVPDAGFVDDGLPVGDARFVGDIGFANDGLSVPDAEFVGDAADEGPVAYAERVADPELVDLEAVVDLEPVDANPLVDVVDADPVPTAGATLTPGFDPDLDEGRQAAGDTAADDPADDDEVAAHQPGYDHDNHNGPDRGLRPLGSAPLLDSEPLPATRPGMLRPRQVDGFSLPAQRPAFDVGPEEPADVV